MSGISAKACLASASLGLLAACGGGGGGSGTEANLQPFTVSVTVTGLGGTAVFQNNGKDDISLSADGSKTFATTLINGDGYNVTVKTHPGGQSCKVTSGSGAIQKANVNIAVACGTNTIGGTVSGLSGTVALQNNAGNDLSISADGVFTFSIHPNFGTGYNVTVKTRPVGQNCTIGNGAGSVTGAVSDIAVTCVGFAPPAPTVSVQPGVKQLGFSWASNVDTTFYHVLQNPDGVSGYTQLGGNFSPTNYTLDLSGALLHTRISASYIVEACNNFGCTGSTPIALASQIINAIGYFKASNAGLGGGLGFSIALSADGSTLAVGARGESSAATGVNNTPGQSDTSASSAGAVYVFVRSGGAWSQQAYIKASNTGSGDQFGYAVALSSDGNTLAVGAPFESSAATGVNNVSPGQGDNSAGAAGAVYVFTRSGTTWTQQAYAKASNTNADDTFGNAVALSGDGNTLAVGAVGEDSAATGINNTSPGQGDNTASFAGAVYVFTRSGSNWSQQAYIKASNTNAQDQIGTSVALSNDGNTLAAGAVGESSSATTINGNQADNSAAFAGAVYVFVRSGTIWTQQAYIKNSNTAAGAQFGFSTALSADGNTLAAGGLGEEAAYVFTRSVTWSQQARITASNSDPGDAFGSSLTLSSDGNTLAVGARAEMSAATGINNTVPGPGDNSLTGTGGGAAYVFARTSGTWTQKAYLKASNTNNGDMFGESVALSGDGSTLAVGAVGESSNATGIDGNQADNSATSAGAVYLY